MSSIYNLEPVTKGKVLLTTSHGEVEVELWAREAPKACRNFVQLCMEGYYDGTIFHRLVKDFCIQGGDPTGTGTGGESIYGANFTDEFHQRLKFIRRGLVAMANDGTPHSNGSQFFITLGETPELQKKHTIFGKVSGNTIFNVLQMSELEADNNERPLEPPSIKSAEILNNPFDDIIPRITTGEQTEKKEKKKEKKKSQMKGTKNFKLLSFGEEAEEDEEEVQEASSKLGKITSAHDTSQDPKLSKEVAVSAEELEQQRHKVKSAAERIREKLKKELDEAKQEAGSVTTENEDKVKTLKEEADKLVNEIKGIGKEEKTNAVNSEKDANLNEDEKQTVNQFRRQLNEFKNQQLDKKSKSKSERENQALSILEQFKKLKKTDVEEKTLPDNIEGEEEEEMLNNINLFSHSLVDVDRTAKVKDANVLDDDTYEIYDPRHPINIRKRQKEGDKSEKEDNKWKRAKMLT